jgi:hypothetical protein
MKTTFYAVGLVALMAGAAMAGDQPRSDGMHADKDGDGRVSRAEATAAGAERSGEWFDGADCRVPKRTHRPSGGPPR